MRLRLLGCVALPMMALGAFTAWQSVPAASGRKPPIKGPPVRTAQETQALTGSLQDQDLVRVGYPHNSSASPAPQISAPTTTVAAVVDRPVKTTPSVPSAGISERRPTRAVTATTAPRPVVRASSGAPGSYQACVAFRESGNGSGSSDIYGFLQSTWSSLGLPGSPYTASRATQDAAFAMLYAKAGRAPWSPYDGC